MAHLPDAPLSHALEVVLPVADARTGRVPALTCEIHEHAVPSFVAAALDRLYGSMYASWRHLQLCEADRPLPHAWVAWHQGEVAAALLFRIEPSRVLVLTEMMTIDASMVDAFCRTVYGRYPQASMIVLNAVHVSGCQGNWQRSWPALSYVYSEDFVIDLPANVDAYRALLGKSTRKTIKGYGNRIERELPDLRWECCDARNMSLLEQRSLVRTLQRFKRDSMQKRGKQAAIDRRDTARLLLLARDGGMFGIARVHGRIVAGSLACRFGDHYVMLLSAADPALAHLRLGFLACYWSVCDCISRQASACHLLWGRYDYKVQLLGRLMELHKIQIHRSRLSMCSHSVSAAMMIWQAIRHQGRRCLLKYSREVIKIINKFLYGNN